MKYDFCLNLNEVFKINYYCNYNSAYSIYIVCIKIIHNFGRLLVIPPQSAVTTGSLKRQKRRLVCNKFNIHGFQTRTVSFFKTVLIFIRQGTSMVFRSVRLCSLNSEVTTRSLIISNLFGSSYHGANFVYIFILMRWFELLRLTNY